MNINNTDYNMKKILTIISVCILGLASCTRPYEVHYGFGLDREELRFKATNTASYFMVYGDGDWTLTLTKDAPWLTLDATSGTGMKQVNVRLTKNEGVARDVTVIVKYHDGSQAELIISQEAASSSAKAYSLSASTVNLLKLERDLTIPATAKFIPESLGELKYWVEYSSEEDKDWIEDLQFNYTDVTLKVKENTSAADRTANIYWTFPVAHWETQDTLSATIVQNALLPAIELAQSYSLDAEGVDSLKIAAKVNWDEDIYDFDLSNFKTSEGVRGKYSKSGNYIALVAEPNTTRQPRTYTLEWRVMENGLEVSKCTTELVQNFYIPPVNITSNGEYANSYVLSDVEEGYYSIDVRLVSGEVPADDIVSAEVLWETSLGLITKCSYDVDTKKLYIGKKANAMGNAVVKLMNASGKVRWSYHFWMTNTGAAVPEITIDGHVFLDRNLGAIANTAPIDGENDAVGMFYQWGRKDPFPAPQNLKTFNGVMTDEVYPKDAVVMAVMQDGVAPTVAIENPSTFYWGNNNVGNEDWSNPQYDEYWNTSEKTDFDPCPYGYVVPDKTQITALIDAHSASASYGNILTCDDGVTNYLCSSGWMRRKLHDTSQYAHTGQHPHYWSTTPGRVDDDCMGAYVTDKITAIKTDARRWGATIRCVKQTKTDE